MKNALVVGGARSGKYIALLLNDDNYNVTLTDINKVDYKEQLMDKNIKVVDNGHPQSLLDTNYDLVVKNPGIKYTTDFIQRLLKLNYKIYSEVEIALQYAKKYNVYAITGTNGKTTTVTLLHKMLQKDYKRAFVAGNIGVPVSEVVFKKGLETAYLALELSSFQLDGIYNLKPKIANITNLEEDHLDYYTSVEEYYLSKQRIYQNQDHNDYLLVNIDDKTILKHLNNPQAKMIKYSLNQTSDISINNNMVIYQGEVLFDITKMKLVGKHNIYNGIVASLMAYLSGVSTASISAIMHSFSGVEHRIEYVDTIRGVRYYNDSKATNIDSTIVALKSFNQPITLIAGGYDKKIAFDKLLEYSDNIKNVILFGETKEKLREVFPKANLVVTLEDAVIMANNLSLESEVVLFSPACASFDQFKDYEERGNLYKKYVYELIT